jgi:hypothetical protein
MPLNTTTPVHRVTRILREGARLIAVQHGQASIDLTPDVIALLDGVQKVSGGFEPARNLFEPLIAGRDVSTHVQFT